VTSCSALAPTDRVTATTWLGCVKSFPAREDV